MSSWSALEMYLGMKTTFWKNIYIANVFGLLFRGFKVFTVIEENASLKNYSSLRERAQKIGF